jgi:hypothetical protein
VRFAPTGFAGWIGFEEDEGEGDDDPEHPVKVSAHKAKKKAKAILVKTSAILKSPGNVAPPSRRLSCRRLAATAIIDAQV